MTNWVEIARQSNHKENKEKKRISDAMNEENLLSRWGLGYEHAHAGEEGYTSLSKRWEDIYKRARDYYNNDAHKGFYDTYSGTRNKQGYVSDTGRWYSELEGLRDTANEGVDELLAELDQYSRYYNEDAVKYVRGLITERQNAYNDAMKDAGEFRDIMSQWSDAKAYDRDVKDDKFKELYNAGDYDAAEAYLDELYASAKDDVSSSAEMQERMTVLTGFRDAIAYQRQLENDKAQKAEYAAYDVDAGQAEIDDIKSRISELEGDHSFWDKLSVAATELGMDIFHNDEAMSRDKEIEELNELLVEKEKYHDEVTRWKNLTLLQEGAAKDPDFESYAEQGMKIENPSATQLFGVKEDDIGNIVTYSRENADLIRGNMAEHADIAGDSKYAQMTDDEVKIYSYYLAKYGKDKAQEYLNAIDADLIQRETDYLNGVNYEFAQDHPFLSSAASVITSLGSGVEYAGDALKYLVDGTIDPYRAEMDKNSLAETTNTVRGAVTDKVDWEIGEWDAFDFLYNTGMSGADSLAASLIPGGSAILGLSAAAQGTNDALERGLSSEQAFWNGAVQGAFEGIFESVSIGKFKSLQEAVTVGGKDVCLNIAKSMLVNASEEACTEVANILYDTIVNGALANYTWEELENGAWKDALAQVGEAAASGAIMGAGFGGIGSAVSHKATKNEGAKFTSDPGALIDEALRLDPNDKYALSLKAKLEGGKKVSQAELGKLSFDNTEKVSEAFKESDKGIRAREAGAREQVENKIEKKISSRVEDKSLRSSLAQSVTKAILGEDVSNAELRQISKNEAALRVLNKEIGADFDVKSGVSVSELRNAISSRQGSSVKLSSENILATVAALSNMDEATERGLYTSYATDVRNGKATPPEDFARAYTAVWAAGKKGVAVSEIDARISSVLSESALATAYKAGERAAKAPSSVSGADTTGDVAVATESVFSPQGEASGVTKEFKGSVTGKTYSAEAARLLSKAKIGTLDTNRSYYKLDDLGIPKKEQQAWIDAGIAKERAIRGQTVVTVNTTVLKDEVKRREKSSQKVLQNSGGSGTIESTQSRRENSDGKEKQHIQDRRRESGVPESQSGTRKEDSRGSRVQGEVGSTKEENPVYASRRPLGLNYDGSETPFNVGDTVEPSENSDIYVNQQRVINEYGVDCYVIKSDVWESAGHDAPAGAYKGKVYVSEDIDPELVATLAPHEGSHIMKQLKFQPYLDFTDKVADMIDKSKVETQKLFEIISEHIGADVLGEMDPGRFYDEMNASIYGFYKAGMMESTGFGELVSEVFYDFDAYIAELDAIHEKYKQEVKAKRDSSGTHQTDTSADPDVQQAKGGSSEWSAERIESGKAEKARPVSEIIEQIRHDFGINITKGHVRGKGVLGQYSKRNHGIRTKIANDLPTVAHELGHALDQRYGLTDNSKLTKEMRSELVNALGDLKGSYKQNLWVSEGLAEYMRRFLQNRDDAARTYPEFTRHFLNSLSKADRVLIDTFADEINAYYALDGDTATSSIRLREEGVPDARTPLEKARDMGDGVYQAWVDANHGIRLFDEATGANTYKLASNAAYSDAIAGQIITGDLTDANGQYVAPGLKAALEGVNIGDKKIYREFGEYLVLKHGPERLNEGMRIFADERKNNAAFMEKRARELEVAHPEFKEAADRLYTFQKQFLQTWAVDTGLLPSEVAEEWAKRWSFYVPLNRAVGKAGTVGAKRGYANQNSTVKKAIGSGLDIVHPVDNIINNIVKMVNAGVRNNVMLEITAQAKAVGADATFLEEVPTPMKKKTADLTGVKAKLHDAFGAAGIGELLAEVEGKSETLARASGQISAEIRIDMDDAERYEILKGKSIQPQKIEVDPKFDIDFEYLEKNIKSEIEKPLIKKLRELGYLKRYKTDAIEVDFEFTGGGLRKSLNSQATAYGGSFADLAKVVLNLQKLLDNSVLIEIHSDKGAGTDLENKQLVQTFVMMSAFAEGNLIVPVQFEVKQFVDNANRLYLAVALTKIETGVVGNTTPDKNQASTYLLPVSSISIADLFSKINIKDENFFKYIPDGFLSADQIDAKKRALAKDEAKYGTKKATSSFSNGAIRQNDEGIRDEGHPTDKIPQNSKNVNKKNSTNSENKKSDAWSKVDEIIESAIDDVLIQYGQGKAHGDVVTVLREGKQEFWKINDALLLESLTNLSQKKMNGIMEAYAVVSRFMTSNITGNNIIWSIFSNFPRDMMTFFTYSKQKNPLKAFPTMGEAYLNKVTGGNAETKNLPYIKEYYALGGGQTSAYTADVDLAKRARKKLKHSTKLQSAAYYANPLNVLSFVSETVESGPRIATYIMMREKGMSPQDAFYESQDITVNFKRGGRLSREFNKAVPFFNASVQGLDKFKRWITCADVPKAQRAKAIAGRVTMYVAVSAALGALIYALNNSDDEDEENYRLLSNYTKNTYWNIPLGDGKYFAIPKPREIAVLSTFIETTCEYFGGNDYAYDEFGDYVADNFLPPFLSDLVTDGMDGALGSLGIIGVASDLKANKDFLGRPIESTSLSGYESQDRYTRRTSQIAYWLGQAAAELGLDWGPVQIDYFFSQVLGGYWKVQKALFPVGSENVDWTLGVQNTYVKDNQYSNDIVNWMYDKATSSAQAAKSHPEDTDIDIEAKLDGDMKSFYSRYYALTKGQKEDAAARRAKRVVLDMIVEYRKASDNGDESEAQKVIYDLIDRCHDTSLLPSVMQTKVKDADGLEHSLRDYQYVEYQTTYNALYWGYVEDNLTGSETDVEMIAIIKKAQTIAKERATEKALESVGAGSSGYFEKYPGIDDSDLITFQSQMDIETDKDGGLSQEELIDILERMVADGLSKEDAYTLFKSRYPTSDKNNPWRSYAP